MNNKNNIRQRTEITIIITIKVGFQYLRFLEKVLQPSARIKKSVLVLLLCLFSLHRECWKRRSHQVSNERCFINCCDGDPYMLATSTSSRAVALVSKYDNLKAFLFSSHHFLVSLTKQSEVSGLDRAFCISSAFLSPDYCQTPWLNAMTFLMNVHYSQQFFYLFHL